MSDAPTRKLIIDKALKFIEVDGILSRALKGFEARPQQQMMMKDIIEAYNENQIALIEAGTGTGKSVAYLIPAILWAVKNGERTVISTHTIALQEQLIHKDIPQLIKATNLPIKAALVKGMNNYICLRKLHDAQAEMQLFPSDDSDELHKIDAWCKTMKEGSRSDLPIVPSASTWDKVGAESDACSHQKCPFFSSCYFFKAREQVEDAQLLVVNHSLLFADLVRRFENDNYDEAAILPAYKRLILDEAHHLEDIATEHLASKLSRMDFLRTLSKLASEKQNKDHGRLPFLRERIQQASSAVPSHEIQSIINRLTIDLPALRRNVNDQAFRLFDNFEDFIDQTTLSSEAITREQKLRIRNEHHVHDLWKQQLMPIAEALVNDLGRLLEGLRALDKDIEECKKEKIQEQTKSVRIDMLAIMKRLVAMKDMLCTFMAASEDTNRVRWIEAQQLNVLTNVQLIDAKLDIAKTLAEVLFSRFSTVILCSATMTTNRRFDFIRRRLGLTKELLSQKSITEHYYESPFDYQQQALLAIPNDIPLPTHPDFAAEANEKIWQAIEASQGNAFVLFTSYAMLQSSYEALKERLQAKRYILFKQGDEHRRVLLNKFSQTKRSVLFGTDSFWEGVDVAGDALRCVILVKLPFKSPGEPIIAARSEDILRRGGDPFLEYAVPNAIVKFKQGFGRLIRNKWDRGCIVCLDTRLLTKGYGHLFLNSLPPCGRVFSDSATVHQQMIDFYRKTHHLAANSPFKMS